MRKTLYAFITLLTLIVSLFVLAAPQGVGPAQIVPAYTVDDGFKEHNLYDPSDIDY